MRIMKAAIAALAIICGCSAADAQGQLPAKTVWGNFSSSQALPGPISQAQLTTLCNVFTTSLAGCVPSSGGGTTNFLRADGTWAPSTGSGIIALTGDVTATGPGSAAATLATVNANVGSFGSATQCVALTVNAKGLVTGASAATCAPAFSSITSTPTTLAGYGIASPLPVNQGGWGLATLTANAIYKGNGTSAPSVSALSDNGTIVSTSEPVNLTSQPLVQEIANASSTGTTLNKLAKLTGAPSTAVIATTSDTSGVVGIVIGGAGTTASAQIAVHGRASCIFDGATTAGDYVQISSTTTGDCHDAGSSYPAAGQVLGRVLSTNGSGGTFAMEVFSPGIAAGGGSGSVTSVAITPGGGLVSTGTCTITTTGTCALFVEQMLPGGRLTVASGVCVPVTDQVAQTTIYYAPCGSEWVPIYDGTNMTLHQFTSSNTDTVGLSLVLTSFWSSNSLYDAYVFMHSGSPTLCTPTAWTNSTTRSTGLAVFKGVVVNASSFTCVINVAGSATGFTCAQFQCTYVGTFLAGASSGTIDLKFGTAASNCGAAVLSVFNAYNRRNTRATVSDTTASWTYTGSAWRAVHGQTTCSATVVIGLNEDAFHGEYLDQMQNAASGASMFLGLGLNSSTALANRSSSAVGWISTVTPFNASNMATWNDVLPLGNNVVYAIEQSDGVNANTFAGNNASGGHNDMQLSVSGPM